MKIQVKKTSEHEARVIERKSIKLVKHVQGKYVVISTLDETGRHVSKEVISYDTQTKRTHSTFVLRGWMINEGVGVPNTKTNSVDWVSSRLSLDRGVRMNLAAKPQFKQIFQTTFAEDGLSFSIQGRGYNKDNKLGAVFTGEYLRIAELPEQDLALTEGVVAYYPFNGNAKDEAGNGHDGTVVGAKLTTDRHGKPNSAYQFKLGDHIKIDGLLGKPKNLSLAAWVKLDGQQGRWGSEIISMGGYVTLRMDNRQSVKNSGTGGLIFSGRTGRSYWVHVMKKANYTGTGWHQVVFTVDDNADKQVTYVDGQKAAAKQNPKSIVYKGSGPKHVFWHSWLR